MDKLIRLSKKKGEEDEEKRKNRRRKRRSTRRRRCSSVVGCWLALPSMCKALGSTLSTENKTKGNLERRA